MTVANHGAGLTGLRERKKVATREGLHEAAVQLAVEQGIDRVTVEAIADRAGVSRRTFSNYFASKEEALFHGDAERLGGVLDLVRAEPAELPPWSVLSRVAERLIAEWGDDLDPAELARRRDLFGEVSFDRAPGGRGEDDRVAERRAHPRRAARAARMSSSPNASPLSM